MSYLPRGKIVVTVVNAEGKAVFEPDLKVETKQLESGAVLRRIFSISQVPVPGINYDAAHDTAGIANETGCEWLECEMPPGVKSPMHATPSIDFGTILTGEITLILDSGEERTLRKGDFYIQKGTSHAWENRGSEPARFATFLAASRP
ncbi:hypothetical protein BJX68DRAFT_272896 [Aspergillus pseudodeflectus]|uniref:Cupin type-2 domain-containing protein n=1 Tax=Aspergillus pseudodeflectus TaxID=176178 RepID=A0ABR4JDJ1_9EURO